MRRTVSLEKGKILGPEALAGLELSFAVRRRASVYGRLLEQLLDSPKGSVLQVARTTSARSTINARATKKGLRVEFAEKDGLLYVQIVPSGAAAPAANLVLWGAILKKLAAGPATALEIGRGLPVELPALQAELARMVGAGRIEQDGHGPGAPVYRDQKAVRR